MGREVHQLEVNMECVQCRHEMRAGKIVEPAGDEIHIWFCDCGYWREVLAIITGEYSTWRARWVEGTKRK